MLKIIKSNGELEVFFSNLAARGGMELVDVSKKVKGILNDVRKNGDNALLEYTRKFDQVDFESCDIEVCQSEIDEAYSRIDTELINTIKRAGENIRSFHEKQKDTSWFDVEKEGIVLGQLIRPFDRVGIYVPGGTAPLISTILMTAIPARVAGVKNIIMTTPPGGKKGINPAMLATAKEAGVTKIFRVGGAQAIAAMAFGTDTIDKVDKIVGPGNIFVAEAKRMVYGYCDIDMVAGPSEILVIADKSANPAFIAADLLSQAEHDIYASSILITTSNKIAEDVREQVALQLEKLDRKDIIKKSLEEYGAIILTDDIESAIALSNRIAPEHLELCVEYPFDYIGQIKNTGAIFMGSFSPEPLGDYFAGPNHVLPTGGTARFFSPLCTSDFIKKSSIISYNKRALYKVKDDVQRFAEAEELSAHANAVRIRFEE